MKTIALCYPVEEKHLHWLADAAAGCKLLNAGQEGIAEAIHEADIFVGSRQGTSRLGSSRRSGTTQIYPVFRGRLDHCLVPSVIESDITVCSASGLFADQVAEQAMALLLGLLRGLPTFFHQTLDRSYVRRPTDDLHHKRIGIVGLGGNGRRLVEVLQPYRVSIRAVDYYPVRKPVGVESLEGPDQLLQLASQSDILLLALR